MKTAYPIQTPHIRCNSFNHFLYLNYYLDLLLDQLIIIIKLIIYFNFYFHTAIQDTIIDEEFKQSYEELYAVFWDRAFLLTNPSEFMGIIDKIENLGGIQYDGFNDDDYLPFL